MFHHLIFYISGPPKAIKPNARVHWAKKARAVKSYRHEANISAMSEWLRNRPDEAPHRPLVSEARVQATFYHRDRRGFADPDNLAASLKPVWDGLQDCGILKNDNKLTHLPILQKIGKPCVKISIEWRASWGEAERSLGVEGSSTRETSAP
jgi:Holliday junction resolvase RusA-like endonuclease